MSDETAENQELPLEWNLDSAETAYSVIARYVEHTQVSGIIIALLAGALGEEKVKFIVQTEHWQKYMSSKRALEAAQSDIQKLTELIDQKHTEVNSAKED